MGLGGVRLLPRIAFPQKHVLGPPARLVSGAKAVVLAQREGTSALMGGSQHFNTPMGLSLSAHALQNTSFVCCVLRVWKAAMSS